jgi:hypothetical protein
MSKKRGRGRPPLPSHLKKQTISVRLPVAVAARAKSGYYQRLDMLCHSWALGCLAASPSSPRWHFMRVFVKEYLKESSLSDEES